MESFEDNRVVNRIFWDKSSLIFEKVISLGYHEQWVHSTLDPLLNAAQKLSQDRGMRGVSKALMPLNTQWYLLKKAAIIDIKIPKFVYAFGGEIPCLKSFANPMQKSVWSLYDWREERHLPEDEINWHRFFVDRPVGTPVICYFAGINDFGMDGMNIIFPRERVAIDMQKVVPFAKSVASAFLSDVGEFLFYVVGDGIFEFRAFSPMMENAIDDEKCSIIMRQWGHEHLPC